MPRPRRNIYANRRARNLSVEFGIGKTIPSHGCANTVRGSAARRRAQVACGAALRQSYDPRARARCTANPAGRIPICATLKVSISTGLWPAAITPGDNRVSGIADFAKMSLSAEPDVKLRVLMACSECARQYDVSGREVGTQLRCACGAVNRVSAVHTHHADVVRCSSCGAPRTAGFRACGYCKSDFTLHERDLNTVCPECAARISDKARFCHFCAIPIAPTEPAPAATQHACPACGDDRRLVSRKLNAQRISVLECGGCGGFWLGNEVFQLLEEQSQKAATTGTTFEDRKHRGRLHHPEDPHGRYYRACPICRTLMHRRNYGRRSGILVDTCKEHGMWFDLGELDKILRWIRMGGLNRARRWEAERAKQQNQTERLMQRIEAARPAPPPPARARTIIDDILDYFLG